MSVFDSRTNFKPFDYPEVEGYRDAINNAFWLVTKWDFAADVQDYKVNMTLAEQTALKNSLLAISQVEVDVKKFWGSLGTRFPRAEFDQVGTTFAESEIRHANAYSELLQVLGFNADFQTLSDKPAIQGRVAYLKKHIRNSATASNEKYALTLTLFSLLVENVSLFSQFLVVKSFNKYRNILKDVDNVIQDTAKEERVHAMFGTYLVNLIKAESPEWFDTEFYEAVTKAAKAAYTAECAIIDWIFEEGDLPYLTKDLVKEFVKYRIDESIVSVGGTPIFGEYSEDLEELRWFDEETYVSVQVDFFHKKSVEYTKHSRSYKAEDLF